MTDIVCACCRSASSVVGAKEARIAELEKQNTELRKQLKAWQELSGCKTPEEFEPSLQIAEYILHQDVRLLSALRESNDILASHMQTLQGQHESVCKNLDYYRQKINEAGQIFWGKKHDNYAADAVVRRVKLLNEFVWASIDVEKARNQRELVKRGIAEDRNSLGSLNLAKQRWDKILAIIVETYADD